MTTKNSVTTVPFPTRLKLSESANFNRMLIKFKAPSQVAFKNELSISLFRYIKIQLEREVLRTKTKDRFSPTCFYCFCPHCLTTIYYHYFENGLLLSSNEESLAIFLSFFFLLYWYMLSPHFILPVKTRIIFKLLNKFSKQTTFRNTAIAT